MEWEPEDLMVLLIDDDPAVRDALTRSVAFHERTWSMEVAGDGEAGLRSFLEHGPGVVLLDMELPTIAGLDVLRRIREMSTTPVIMLSARDDTFSIARSLALGADDYVTKPFSSVELVARIRVQARRAAMAANARPAGESYSVEGLTIRFSSQEVFVEGQRVHLTKTEYRLLAQLVLHAGTVVPYRPLLKLVWGSEGYDVNVVRVNARRLRAKIEQDLGHPQYVLTKAGVGLLFPAGQTSSDRWSPATPTTGAVVRDAGIRIAPATG